MSNYKNLFSPPNSRARKPVALLNLALSLTFIFGAALACGRANEQGSATGTRRGQSEATALNGGDLSILPGTDWLLWEEHKTMTDTYVFCSSGRWELHDGYTYGGRYRISGSRIVMTSDDGSTYADCRLSSQEGDELYLQCGGGQSLHLKYHGKVNCK
jgi:hypothetical protein